MRSFASRRTSIPANGLVIIEDTAEIQCAARQTNIIPVLTEYDPIGSHGALTAGQDWSGSEGTQRWISSWLGTRPRGRHREFARKQRVAALNRLSFSGDGPKRPREMIESLIGEAVDVIVHIARTDGPRRRVRFLR
jgi:Flp pilus assembly CpaF family ATPase